MARLIFSIVFLIAIAVLIVMNVGSTASVNVFGWKVEELSVTVVAIVSFVTGVLYSFIFYLIAYLERGRKDRLAKRKQKLRDQEQELKSREQAADELAEASRRKIENADRVSGPMQIDDRRGPLAALFGRVRDREEEPVPAKPEAGEPPKRTRKK